MTYFITPKVTVIFVEQSVQKILEHDCKIVICVQNLDTLIGKWQHYKGIPNVNITNGTRGI